MGEKTGISWTDHTWNPWWGCTKVGPGCDHCYAEAMDDRQGGGHWGVGAPRRKTGPHNWGEPARWNRALIAGKPIGRKVFACSMADFFDNEVPDEWRAEAWPIIEQTRALRWQLCTKRIGNVRKMVPPHWTSYVDFSTRPFQTVWPKHVGVLATMVDQEEVDRDMPKLLELKRFGCPWVGVSYEPALGPISFRETGRPDWVIIGGESGPQARVFDQDWAVALLDECALGMAAVFMKQLGSNVSARYRTEITGKGDKPAEWPDYLRVQEFPAALRN